MEVYMTKNVALVLFIGIGLVGSALYPEADTRLILGIMLIGWSAITMRKGER